MYVNSYKQSPTIQEALNFTGKVSWDDYDNIHLRLLLKTGSEEDQEILNGRVWDELQEEVWWRSTAGQKWTGINLIWGEIFLSSTSWALWLNQGECLKINYTSIQKWRWASTHWPRKARLLSVFMQKPWGQVILSTGLRHLWELSNKERGLMGPGRSFFIASISQFHQGWTISLEAIIKYSSGLSFSMKIKGKNPSSPHWVCLICLNSSCKARRKGEEKRREGGNDKSPFFAKRQG